MMSTDPVRTKEEAEDLVRGLALLGTGGGGRPDMGRWYAQGHLDAGRPLAWIAPEAVPDDAWTCCVFGMGSMAPVAPLSAEERRRLGYPDAAVERPMVEAIRHLSAYSGRSIAAVVALELGAANTMGPLDAALRLGVPLVDGEYCGRAIPMLSQATPAIYGFDVCPVAVCDAWGNVLIIKQAPSTMVAERLGKMISIVSKLPDPRPPCAHAGFLLQGRDMKRMVIPNSVSQALAVGRAIREARARGADPAAAAARAAGGRVLFTGRVMEVKWESREGYMFGTTKVEGQGADAGRTASYWYQNENHVLWKEGRPLVTSPDLIMVMERTGEPRTNADVAEGMEVAILGAPAHALLRSEAALRVLGPRFFGFDIDYRPFEDAVRDDM